MRLVRSPLPHLFLASLLFSGSECTVLESLRSLGPAESLQYINGEPGFRASIDSGGCPLRFNLGDEFRCYMTDAEFRGRVLALVDNNPERVWSDVERLELIGPQVFDMRDLTGLANLHYLTVKYSQVVNLAAVGALTTLKSLRLWFAGIQDVSVLSGLVHLRMLSLQGTQVTGLSELAGNTSLAILSLSHTGIHDMNDIRRFVTVRHLYLAGDNLINAHVLAELTNLQRLFVNGFEMPDIRAFVAGFMTVNPLHLSGENQGRTRFTRVRRLSPNLRRPEVVGPSHGEQEDGINAFIAQVQPVVSSHARIARVLPEDESHKTCSVCLCPVTNLQDCLVTCNGNNPHHRGCLQQCIDFGNGTCPCCRAPLGPLPEWTTPAQNSFRWSPLSARSSPNQVATTLMSFGSRFIASMNLF